MLSPLQQFLDGVDAGVGQIKALDLGLGGVKSVSLPALLFPHHQGQLSCFAVVRGGATLTRVGSALLHCTGEGRS